MDVESCLFATLFGLVLFAVGLCVNVIIHLDRAARNTSRLGAREVAAVGQAATNLAED